MDRWFHRRGRGTSWAAPSPVSARAWFPFPLLGLGPWFWAVHDADQARQAMLMVPAIGPDLLARAHREMGNSDRLLHMTIGAMTGVPYKLYAVEDGARGVNSLVLVIATVIARQPRFLLTAAAAVLGAYSLARLGLVRFRYVFWAGAWLIVYAIYFGMRMTA